MRNIDYRIKLGTSLDTCMACCANLLSTKKEINLGLCKKHHGQLIKPPKEVNEKVL